jgi:hypothetical protein
MIFCKVARQDLYCGENLITLQSPVSPMLYHALQNSRLDFSDAPVSRGLALTGETYNFGE